ncbi:MAG TPA: efflux RND transporter periplasmic adaptor subunit [Candidatus Ozemobacteraceae bacterium]|nr:efflux RND transporter periplasmic adaptor subunit [Candidatus Ozemobacteraceae bacterium]
MKKYLILGIVLVAAIGFGVTARLSAIRNTPKALNVSDYQTRKGIPVVVTRPRRRALTVDLELLGTVAPVREVAVSARVAEEVTSTSLMLGRPVKRHEVLVELYDEMIAARLRQAEAAAAQTRSMLDKLLAGARPQEVKQAEARLEGAQAGFASAEKEYQRMGSLKQNNAIPEQKAEKVIAAFEGAKAELQAAKQQLSLVREGARKEDIRMAEAAHQQALANLELARIQMRQTKMSAPIDGVISKINKELGEQTEVGKPVFSLMDLDTLHLLVDVPRTRIHQVRTGQTARIVLEEPRQETVGTITEVKPDADPMSRTYLAKIQFRNPNGVFKPGMFVRAFVKLDEKPDALVLPKDCLAQVATQTGLFLVNDQHRVSFAPVTVGLSSSDDIEVISDLSEKATVVLQGQKHLVQDTLVDPTPQS